jgi:hypothetical protein
MPFPVLAVIAGVAAAASIATSAVSAANAASDRKKAMTKIGKLPNYQNQKPVSEALSLYSKLNERVEKPYTAESDTAFNSMLAQSSNNAYQRGISADPSLSGAIMTGMNTAGLQQGAQRQLQGDQLRANYMAQLGGVVENFQGLSNSNITGFNARLNQQEVALGTAASNAQLNERNALTNMPSNAINTFGSVYNFGGAMEGGAGGANAGAMTGGAGGANAGLSSNQTAGFYNPNQQQIDWSDTQNTFGQTSVQNQQQMQTGNQQLGWTYPPTWCWVARAAYGERNPKWLEFRTWITTQAPKIILDTYVKYGERFAEYITDKPVLKFLIRKLMDTILYWNKPSISIA